METIKVNGPISNRVHVRQLYVTEIQEKLN